jgi:acid phosphatase (class A)
LKTYLVIAGLAAALLAGAAAPVKPPADPSLGPPPGELNGYFKTSPLDGKAILGPPPAPDSPQGRADQMVFEQTRALQGSARWKTAIQDNDLWTGGALQRFSCALGVDVNARQTPTLWRMLHRLENDVRIVGSPAKSFYDRKRPLIGNDLPICVPREDWMKTNASYPSGHAMTAWSWGLIMAEADPRKASDVLALARDSGQSRVVCGVHYQSDVDAGRLLGAAMVARLHDVPEFRTDLAKAKAELAAAKGKPQGGPSLP